MPYIDALFFASGSSTQSGLNTIDLNKIKLYQQVVIMLIAAVCNPIFINTFVVFIRLYWFEKRFQNVVLEARSLKRNKTRSRSKSQTKHDLERDIGLSTKGVGDREIVVLRTDSGEAKGEKIEDEVLFKEGENGTVWNGSDRSSGKNRAEEMDSVSPMEPMEPMDPVSPMERFETPIRKDIIFEDEVDSPLERRPERQSEKSIEFVQNQRNPKDTATLRIPGPRDYDRGFKPQRIEEGQDSEDSHDQDNEQEKDVSNDREREESNVRRHRSSSVPRSELNADDHRLKQHITIDVPHRPRPNTGPSAYALNVGRAKTMDRSTDRTIDISSEKTVEPEAPTSGMQLRNRRTKTFGSILSRSHEEERDPMPYFSSQPTVGRNSAFVDLNEEQREELGGIEYRALKLLAIILVCYYVGFHLLGMICLLPWIVRDGHYSSVVIEDGINPVWWGFFTPASMFNDLGFTLTPDSMISFQFAVFPLVLGTFLIIIGNTGFPCMLRFVIWLCSKCVPKHSGPWEELRFLLDHPRRCFTLLFPSKANWWLFWVLILLNGIDLIFFVILDLKDPTVTALPPGFRFLDGLFQAAATRTAGFAVVNIAELHPAIQVSYLIMMYISVFPIAISMRQTNVYEEKSLGVWSDDDEDSDKSFLGTHLRRQLSFDLWFVFLGFFLIAIIEGTRLENTNDFAFTLFSVLFEIVSAYGTVGLSLGYPDINASFSSEMKPLSKLIIIAMQLRGRHRGLPYALDRAILLPSESLHKKEEEDATRRARRGSNVADLNDTAVGRVPTNITRRNSAATVDGGVPARKIRPTQVRRFLSGALSAGPSIPRQKKA